MVISSAEKSVAVSWSKSPYILDKPDRRRYAPGVANGSVGGNARRVRVGKERVRKLMAQHGIRARHMCMSIATTNSNHNLPVAPNLLERTFTARAPNQP
jgi:transposase InsO family protein